MDLNYRVTNLFPVSIHEFSVDGFDDIKSELIDYAVKESIKKGQLTRDLSPKNFVSTSDLGDWIANKILNI